MIISTIVIVGGLVYLATQQNIINTNYNTLNGQIVEGFNTSVNYFGQTMTIGNIYKILGKTADAATNLVDITIGVAVSVSGDVYVASNNFHVIIKIDKNGTATKFAGTRGQWGTHNDGNGGQATSAKLRSPTFLAIDDYGNVYVSESANQVVRKIDTSGIITTFAGNGTQGYSGDGGQATSAQLHNPLALTVDSLGNVYVTDSLNKAVRKINTSGIITTLAVMGQNGFTTPGYVAADRLGNVYVTDTAIDTSVTNYAIYDYKIKKFDKNGTLTTIAGAPYSIATFIEPAENSQATTAYLGSDAKLACDALGNVYVFSHFLTRPIKILKITTNGIISTIAGSGYNAVNNNIFAVGVSATDATVKFKLPGSIAVDASGNVYMTDKTYSALLFIPFDNINRSVTTTTTLAPTSTTTTLAPKSTTTTLVPTSTTTTMEPTTTIEPTSASPDESPSADINTEVPASYETTYTAYSEDETVYLTDENENSDLPEYSDVPEFSENTDNEENVNAPTITRPPETSTIKIMDGPKPVSDKLSVNNDGSYYVGQTIKFKDGSIYEIMNILT
jgi:hypothetical protein